MKSKAMKKDITPSEELRHAAVLATADPISNTFWEDVARELEEIQGVSPKKPAVEARPGAKKG